MSTWQTPKTDWVPNDGVQNADFNRIEGNIEYLQSLNPEDLKKKIIVDNYSTTGGVVETGIQINRIVSMEGVRENQDTAGHWVPIHKLDGGSFVYFIAIKPNATDSALADLYFPDNPSEALAFRLIINYAAEDL